MMDGELTALLNKHDQWMARPPRGVIRSRTQAWIDHANDLAKALAYVLSVGERAGEHRRAFEGAQLSRASREALERPLSDTEAVANWMIARGYATGHGDTTEDILAELEWQAKDRGARSGMYTKLDAAE